MSKPVIENPGMLNRQVTIKGKVESSRDGYNNPVYTDSTIGPVWGQIETGGGRLFYAAQKLHAESSIAILIRYRTDVNVGMQAEYGGQSYLILATNDVDMRHEAVLMAAKEAV